MRGDPALGSNDRAVQGVNKKYSSSSSKGLCCTIWSNSDVLIILTHIAIVI